MKAREGMKRVVIERVEPEIDSGRFPIKRAVREKVVVRADVFCDSHDSVAAALLFRRADEKKWCRSRMKPLFNDRWEGSFMVEELGSYFYTIKGWTDPFRTWLNNLEKKFEAGQDLGVELLVGADIVERAARNAAGDEKRRLAEWAEALRNEKDARAALRLAASEDLHALMEELVDESLVTDYGRELEVRVDPETALFSAWYEFFPRSHGPEPGKHGTFKDCEALLREIKEMGFDVVYLPPIHPIGKTNRKGKNNSPVAEPGDPGSPWAIGSKEGGHKSVHPALGTLKDFERFVKKAEEHGLRVALDLAFQCSVDHPYVKERPDWFRWRPDNSIQHAENPPKKYEDVVPFNFETESAGELWEELKSIVDFWIAKGVKIFRVDNPHTKPILFWEWLIGEIKKSHPEVIFLSEAFTRPKVMARLAKAGFNQSYTYFTWRNTKSELTDYLTELTRTELKEYFRPSFWPNTPDILPEYLQYGGRPAFITRLVLAATLSSNYGIYGPAFELCISDAVEGREEYLDSEKYEIKSWDRDAPGNLKDLIARVNRIRRENPALKSFGNLRFFETDSEYLLFYGKATEDLSNVILVAVNLDPFHPRSGRLRLPLKELGIAPGQPYLLHDLLGDEKYIWQGEENHIELNPRVMPAQIFAVHRRLRKESDFDYFM